MICQYHFQKSKEIDHGSSHRHKLLVDSEVERYRQKQEVFEILFEKLEGSIILFIIIYKKMTRVF